MGLIKKMVKEIIIAALRLYKLLVSPLLPPSCRFQPTCSDYAAQAVRDHGAPKGIFFAAKRLLRCHPYTSGGYDPVPSAASPTICLSEKTAHGAHRKQGA